MDLESVLLGRYCIKKALAAGSFGETYLAIDIHLGQRQVVVKHIKPLNNDPDTIKIAKRMWDKSLYNYAASQLRLR